MNGAGSEAERLREALEIIAAADPDWRETILDLSWAQGIASAALIPSDSQGDQERQRIAEEADEYASHPRCRECECELGENHSPSCPLAPGCLVEERHCNPAPTQVEGDFFARNLTGRVFDEQPEGGDKEDWKPQIKRHAREKAAKLKEGKQ